MSGGLELISAIVPVHNGARFLLDALDSILRQTYSPVEIIVVDDGSSDQTAERIAGLGDRVRSVYQAQRGPAAARNHGVALARGAFVAFLDADDLWPSNALHARRAHLLADPTLDVVLGRIQPIRANGEAGTPNRGGADPMIGVQLGSALFRRRAFDRVGAFDERLVFSEDHDWFLRAREQRLRIGLIDEVTLLHRRHGGNMTRGTNHQDYGLARVLKASLDRRRAGGAPARTLPKLSEYGEVRSTSLAEEHSAG